MVLTDEKNALSMPLNYSTLFQFTQSLFHLIYIAWLLELARNSNLNFRRTKKKKTGKEINKKQINWNHWNFMSPSVTIYDRFNLNHCLIDQVNLHGPIAAWNNSNEFMLHKQLIQWRKRLGLILYWERKKVNGGRTLNL